MKKNKDLEALYKSLLALESSDEVRMFLEDLCTPAELDAMADRWKAVQLLEEGLPYREIYELSGVSTATVTRVARCLSSGAGGYRLMLDRLDFADKAADKSPDNSSAPSRRKKNSDSKLKEKV